MNANDYQKVKEIFHAALRLPAVERSAFLNARCSDNDAVRHEIERLLDSYQSGLMETPAIGEIPGSAANVSLKPGRMIKHYRIRERLGSGGMGEVYLADDTILKRPVAIKLLPKLFTSDVYRLRRFQQEVRAASALNHPNILTIYEVGTFEEMHFIAAEFIDGTTLRSKITRDAPLPSDEAVDLALQIATGLSTVHRAGIIHRDIKPENIMIREDGLVKILDFGLAKLVGRRPAFDHNGDLDTEFVPSTPGIIMGTASYMAPEQARGTKIDERTDIWSLGVVLYEMLSGKQPFEGITPSDIIASVLTTEPLPVSFHVSSIPLKLEDVVEHSLKKEVEERYRTSNELLGDLETVKSEMNIGTVVTSGGSGVVTSGRLEMIVAATLGLSLLAAIMIGFGFLSRNGSSSANAQFDSIAVLPLVNASGDESIDYLSDGLSASLIERLSILPQLRVAPRSSSFRFRDPDPALPEIANQLGVTVIIKGSVVTQGDQLIVHIDIVDARNDRQLWDEDYQRKFSDVISIQQEIAQTVATKLQIRLSGTQSQTLTSVGTTDSQAYELFMKGRYHVNRGSEIGSSKALDYFQAAIEHDPNYALAYAALADVYIDLCLFHVISGAEGFPKARIAAEKAIELDDKLSGPHGALGAVKFYFDRNLPGAEQEYQIAIKLDPNSPQTFYYFSIYLMTTGRADEALEKSHRAEELEPLSIRRKCGVATILYRRREYDKALKQLQKALELDPNSGLAHYWIGMIYAQIGRYSDAIVQFQSARLVLSGGTDELAMLGYVYARSGQRRKATQVIKELTQRSEQQYVSPLLFSYIYVALGDKDRAFEWLDRAVDEREHRLLLMPAEPQYDDVRSDARFDALLHRIGLS